MPHSDPFSRFITKVSLKIEPFDTEPNELYVSAPIGFVFTEECLNQGGTEVTTCIHVEPNNG